MSDDEARIFVCVGCSTTKCFKSLEALKQHALSSWWNAESMSCIEQLTPKQMQAAKEEIEAAEAWEKVKKEKKAQQAASSTAKRAREDDQDKDDENKDKDKDDGRELWLQLGRKLGYCS